MQAGRWHAGRSLRDGLGEIGDKFRSDVTLPMQKFEVVTSHTRAGDKEMTFFANAYEISESICYVSHWCCAP